MDKLKTALHEAGHAVANVRFGFTNDLLTIIPVENRYGAVQSGGVEQVGHPEDAHNIVQTYCAGFAALIAHGYSTERALVGCEDDFDNASELIKTWGLAIDLEQYKQVTVTLMSDPKNVAAVKMLADYVLPRGRVMGDVIEVLVMLSDGECTQAEFERFMAGRPAPSWEANSDYGNGKV